MKHAEKVEKLKATVEPISEEFWEVLEDQTKKAAANVLIMFGEGAFKPDGFIVSQCKMAEATLGWLLDEGYVTLTEKPLATEDELAERRAKKSGATTNPNVPRDIGGHTRAAGAYL